MIHFNQIMSHTLARFKLIHGRLEPGLVFDAVKRIIAAGYRKGYPLFTQDSPGEHIHSHGGVHARIRAKGVKSLFDVRIHANAQS
jgi:hypothetical protein